MAALAVAFTVACTQGSDVDSPETLIRTKSDLAAYAGITEVPGQLTISCEDCTSLEALGNLRTVNGNLRIENNPMLASIEGLAALSAVSSVYIAGNPVLLSIDSLDRVTALRELHVISNSALQSIDGLRGVTSVDHVEILDNDSLQRIEGLSALAAVASFAVVGNPSLVSMSGFSRLAKIRQAFIVSFNDSLPNCDIIALRDSIGIENIHGDFPTDCACDTGIWEMANCE